MLIEMAGMLSGHHGWVPAPLQFALALVMQTVVAWPFYQSALRAARGGSANMETLISIGSLAAFFGSVSVMVGGLTQGLVSLLKAPPKDHWGDGIRVNRDQLRKRFEKAFSRQTPATAWAQKNEPLRP